MAAETGPRVAVILGAAVWAEGPSPTLRRRTAAAAALWHEGRADHFVPCGGLGRHPPEEARAMADLLAAAGVPKDRISPEARSTSTAENLRLALPILAGLAPSEVLVVSDAYHLPRARIIARRLGLRVRGIAPPWRGAHWPTQLRGALREVPACLAYLTGLRRP